MAHVRLKKAELVERLAGKMCWGPGGAWRRKLFIDRMSKFYKKLEIARILKDLEAIDRAAQKLEETYRNDGS